MNNKQARSMAHTLEGCGCVFLVLGQVPIGVILFAIGLLFTIFMGRCPNCGKILWGVGGKTQFCPKCHGKL